MAAADRFSTSICTVTRVPGGDADVGQAPPDGDPLAAPPDEERGDRRQRRESERDDLERRGSR